MMLSALILLTESAKVTIFSPIKARVKYHTASSTEGPRSVQDFHLKYYTASSRSLCKILISQLVSDRLFILFVSILHDFETANRF